MQRFDLIVLGAGPGGYVAAIRAAQLGLRTALVEREHLGGVCLNWGCIPTKALLHSAELYEAVQQAAEHGLDIGGCTVDIGRMVQRSRRVAAQLAKGVRHLLRKHQVSIVDGHGRLAEPGVLAVTAPDGQVNQLAAPHIVLATGARARVVPPLEPDGRLVWTAREAMTPQRLPRSLLVVGSGAIGIEFASFYRSLGSEVTVVEQQDRVLPLEDEDISALARQAFEQRGMTLLTGATVSSLAKGSDSVTVSIDAGGQRTALEVERVISAVGIVGNVEQLGLEHTAVRVQGTHIVTDEWCRTGEPGVYAIGDLAGPPWLAHKASHEAVLCVEKIAGVAGVQPLAAHRIPGCIYSRPQVASIGLTERQARELGHELEVGRFPFAGNGKAIALGQAQGLVKTLFDARSGELLGAHMIGPEVTELIQGYGVGMALETTEAELIHTVFAHPTLSEAMHEAVLAAKGRAIHA